MVREFWSGLLTEKSWSILQELKKQYKFILIGGWAIYLLTRKLKSKDIDIIISIEELQKFKAENLEKNDKLKKYGVKKDEIGIDIYVEYYSKLVIPVEEIKNYTIKMGGFELSSPEMLLILKQAAYKNRWNSVKGEKDKIDVMSLVFFSNIDFDKYKTILKKYSLAAYFSDLLKLIKNFKDYDRLDLNPREFKIRKNKILIALL